ncbi:uncharacterized protein LOC132919163 isoform X2 [Rhopalosiphum padi]|uniref:uncharacterized protein LOC132919163 isoform X2 n=1 Tax=Rhopalosiphum padi TaxID=40932 RepID=UPI00298EBC13|nr:uncharacterized protein LOC132919163 isoform X2 [Rhopalosiphum padi]
MKVTYSWIIYSCIIVGIDVFCERILEKRQTVSPCKIADQYTCISGQCINETSICDGTRDCNDGSDETLALCETVRCENNQFRCKYGACVNMDSKCDGVKQCADGSDEENCLGHISISADTSTLKFVNNTTELKTESNKKNLCILPSLEGIIYSYQGSDDILAHGTLINHNRTVIENCEIGYHKVYPNSFRVCQNDGKWKLNAEKLCLKCGRSYIRHQLLIYNGRTTQVGTAPWNVAVYLFRKESSMYDLICGGSLIAPNLVVSAAHCFWQKGMISNRISVNNGLYRIAVGKYYRNFTVIDNDFTQMMDVETIYLKEDYLGFQRFYSEDIAVIVLSNRVNISDSVAPVCVDWNGTHNVTNGTKGQIVGWGNTEKNIPSPVLLEATLPYIDYNSCWKMYRDNNFQMLVTYDKFCAGYTSGQGVGEGDSGAGLTFLHSDFYYLTGIVSVKEKNTNNSIALFTNVRLHMKWLRDLYYKYGSSGSDNMLDMKNACVLPAAEGVIYSYEDSDKILFHGTLIKQHRVVIENCEVGYDKAYPNGLRICQGNGEWISNSTNLCFKKCPPLLSDSLDIKCTLNGKNANCSNPSIPNTLAIQSCKSTHRLRNRQEGTSIELRCQFNGTWNNQLYRCTPYCGRPYIRDNLLIHNGSTTAQVGTAPWNVGIYLFNIESSKYVLICGGSLIAPNLVVSVAHCFWQNGMLSKRISINNGLYKIAIGKYYRNYKVFRNESTQIMDVETINLKEDYRGYSGLYSEDIAVIVLSKRVNISDAVAPVCVDWNGIHNVTNGTQGKIVGWGNTEKNRPSPVLLEANLTYIDNNSCRNIYRIKDFQKFITFDKFCAGSTSGQAVREGDSGAGLTFLHSDFYFLTGIMSVRESNANNSIALFTNVMLHIKWLHELYNKYGSFGSDTMLVTNNVCVLPTVEGIIFSYEGSDKVLSHGTLINPLRIVFENCEIGYYKASPNSFRVCQENGEWKLNSEILCFKTCPPLLSDSLNIKCTLNGTYANCSNPSIPNTIAKQSCKQTQMILNGQEETPIELRCQSNGTWNNDLYRCTSYCGRPFIRDQLLIHNGNTAEQDGIAPWNVLIYRFSKESSNYYFICSGSLISQNLVVSVAHCFWENGRQSNLISINDGSYKVAVRKYTQEYSVIDNEFTQIMDVKIIYLHEDYSRTGEFFVNDIAVIVLNDKVSISDGVAPVCIDWSGKYNVPNATQGKIIGWEIMVKKNLPRIVLRERTLSYIDQSSCRSMYLKVSKGYLFADKFCAVNASNVNYHIQWIRELYNKYT